MRDRGFYFVRLKGQTAWTVGRYEPNIDTWVVLGLNMGTTDDDFETIGPRIKEPPRKTGFYRILDGAWEIAYYDQASDQWRKFNGITYDGDEHFDEIGDYIPSKPE